MGLIIPKSVGGDTEAFDDAPIIAPVEQRASNLVIPADVGGDLASEEVQQPIQQEPARPLSHIIPEVVESVQNIQAPE